MLWKLQENVLEQADIEKLVDFIRSTKRFTQFEKVREFEKAWSKWQGCKYSVFVNSGSSANLVIINALKELYGWEDGDEIIVPAVTWPTDIASVIQSGLKPVFVDINLGDFSFDYDAIESKITLRTRAIFVTHLIGFPADISRIESIVGSRDIKILEDCCESHGAQVDGAKVGNLGLCSSFSFYWGHHITTIEGGMICTDNENIYKLAVLKRSHGLVRELPTEYHDKYASQNPDIDFSFLFLTDGFNVRNTEFNAVLGLEQIKHLDKYIDTRNNNHNRFLEIIRPYKKYLRPSNKEGLSSFCLPFIFYDNALREKFQAALREADIEVRPLISGNLLRQPFLSSYGDQARFKNAEFLHTNAFYIGNNQFVDEKRLGKLEKIMEKFFDEEA